MDTSVSTTVTAVTLTTALGAAAMGGVFFAFSSFVMPALGRLPAAQGIAAMQSVNVTAVRPAFMTGLFGTALLSAGLVVYALVTWGDRRAVLLAVGGVLYLVGTIGLTIAYHVPLNDALAAVDPGSVEAGELWVRYLRDWTRANSVRSAAALGAAVAYILALRG
jgi:uncharacterized membrane protein